MTISIPILVMVGITAFLTDVCRSKGNHNSMDWKSYITGLILVSLTFSMGYLFGIREGVIKIW